MLNKYFYARSMVATVAFAMLMVVCITKASAADTTLQSISPFPFGASINTTLLRNNATYRAVVAREYNSLTAENVMKMEPIHPAINTYNWVNADALVNFAQQYNKRIHGHTLVWHQSLPNWVTNYTGDSAAWENLLKTHIQTVVSHYQGRLTSWDVVNEAFNDDGTLRSSIWLQHLGPDYIARCFRYAHEADPAALLFYNDYGHEYSTAKLNAIAALMNRFKTNGVPVHGVGLQMHMNRNSSNTGIANAISVMVQTGLKVHISELDISLNPENNQSLILTPALLQLQADKYKFVTRIYKNIPVAQRFGITTWNVSDADSWIPVTYNRPDWPLPFDSLYQKKPAYQGIIDGLTSNWKYDASGGKSIAGAYTDLGSNGTVITTNYSGNAMTNDNDNSSVQQIGFDFEFDGSMYHEFVLNTNGYIKLGAIAPSSPSIFYPTSNGNTNSVITAPDIDMLYPYNHDLTGTSTTEYRVYTSGTAGSRVCTIQYKDVADKPAPAQYANMQFQVKLYETSNIIEYVYGAFTASTNASTLITAAVGIKGLNAANSVNLAKGSATNWSAPLSTANGIYFLNGDYAQAGPQFNSRNSALPDEGRIYRFVPLGESALPVTLLGFYAVYNKTGITLTWLTANEFNNRDFDVERSLNGIDFKPISTLPAKGNTNPVPNSYSFTDVHISNLGSIVYYRLKQNDRDGNAAFSRVIAVSLSVKRMQLAVRVQNPFKDMINLQVTTDAAGKVLFLITSASGVVLLKKEAPVQAGANLVSLHGAAILPKGIYFLQCSKGKEVSNIKLLKD